MSKFKAVKTTTYLTLLLKKPRDQDWGEAVRPVLKFHSFFFCFSPTKDQPQRRKEAEDKTQEYPSFSSINPPQHQTSPAYSSAPHPSSA